MLASAIEQNLVQFALYMTGFKKCVSTHYALLAVVSKLSDSSLGHLVSQPSGFLASLVSITKAAEESCFALQASVAKNATRLFLYIYMTHFICYTSWGHLRKVMGNVRVLKRYSMQRQKNKTTTIKKDLVHRVILTEVNPFLRCSVYPSSSARY